MKFKIGDNAKCIKVVKPKLPPNSDEKGVKNYITVDYTELMEVGDVGVVFDVRVSEGAEFVWVDMGGTVVPGCYASWFEKVA